MTQWATGTNGEGGARGETLAASSGLQEHQEDYETTHFSTVITATTTIITSSKTVPSTRHVKKSFSVSFSTSGLELSKESGSNSDPQSDSNKKRSKSKETRRMLDEEIERYPTYEDYLDSLVSEEDHFYLEDEAMARTIAELGYRSSGDTLSRENFYKMKARLAEKKMLTSRSSTDQKTRIITDDNSLCQKSALVQAIQGRISDIISGNLCTLLFMQIRVPRKTNPDAWVEISGFIDLSSRFQKEDFVPYLVGKKDLVPRKGDLTFYNWSQGKPALKSSENIEVFVAKSKLKLRHRASDILIDVSRNSLTEEPSVQQRGFQFGGWSRIEQGDLSSTMIFICDFQNLASIAPR